MIAARRSLRRRLTVLNTTIGSIVLCTAGIAVIFVSFALIARPEAMTLAQTARDIVAAAAVRPASEPTRDIVQRIIVAKRNAGIKLIAIPAEAMREAPNRRPPEDFGIAGLFGLYAQLIPIRDAAILVVPNPTEIERLLRAFLGCSIIIVIGSIVIAWLVARVMARRAVDPLLIVTAELERFASGDFSPRSLAVEDETELGALAAAYNGAADQVTKAFLERQRVEDQIRQFVAEAGHELRTPLTVVAGYVDILRRGGDGDAEVRAAAFVSLGVELKRMRALVERLMTLARLDSHREIRLEVVDVNAIVQQAVDALTVTSDVPMTFTTQDDLFVLGEPGDVYEAVANLVENAIKYGHRSPISVRATAEGQDISVRVSDGGPGIAEIDRARIFERFYRVAASGQPTGSGLGLAIADKAAERLGGRLVLEDGTAGRTTFALHVPATMCGAIAWDAPELNPSPKRG